MYQVLPDSDVCGEGCCKVGFDPSLEVLYRAAPAVPVHVQPMFVIKNDSNTGYPMEFRASDIEEDSVML